MKERINKLLTVKSIMTLLITAVFCYLSARGRITTEQFVVIFTTIIGFYFGTQKVKE